MMLDQQIRLATFNWLNEQIAIHGDVLPRKILETGFIFEDHHIHLVAPQGIFTPKILDLPLSITTAPKGPYDDSFNSEGFLLYKYRGIDPNHFDNVRLRRAMEKGVPLVYFHGVIPGKYLAVYPVYIIEDDPGSLTFKVAVDELTSVDKHFAGVKENAFSRRMYITATIRTRLHQRSFRERVLDAYRSQCALCRLRHVELLDAAHIIPDTEPEGTPTVDNGLALCKLHHAAFDSFIIGVSPDYVIEVRQDVLDEEDGPMLLHGLKALHHNKIFLPRTFELQPNREYLDWRYQRFRKAI
jgi:putative restriction endonuclease